MKKLVVVAISTALLAACGGGSSSSTPTPRPGPSPTIQPNGIYKSADAVMVIDTAIANGVLAADSTNNLYSFDSATVNNETLALKGVRLWSDGLFVHDPEQAVSITFDGNTASAMAVIDGTSFVHSFTKQPDSLALNQITGTHTNADDGSTWAIDSEGNIAINGMCTFSGTLTKNNHYYRASVTATACTPSSYDGNYNGAAFTVSDGGTIQLVGALYNDTNMIWGTVPVN
ncbi:hypothetical protein [Photobacterium lipolyticum]|uniref:Transferrin-binding protein B C-lobe/N-lobe beta barrel domain-containing protein n=1 Tax=Photobacterium lipolyticum TaxID=266810 RepID=A0A2T3N1Q3_9GAMM|nr:hypothetical protein [Photobacterium lipolyticum]PSW06260.1 hypothetical protein C9I89_07060 [Photobacterium lipolyticum]